MFFFDPNLETFEMFTMAHLIPWLIVFIVIALMVVFKDRISTKLDLYLRRSTAILMIFLEWMFYYWVFSTGTPDLTLLPLGVCALSMYITSYALWTKNEKVFQLIFPWAISGALISLVVANMSFSFPHFRYIHYFGNHGLFMLGHLYLLIVCKLKFNYKHLLKSSLVLFIYTVIIYPINFLLDTNHLFLREVPHEAAPLYSFLGTFWVLGFIFSIFMLFHVVYLPVFFYNKKRQFNP
jgi:hypothetical integral membrane protein (TIGR02206 family)